MSENNDYKKQQRPERPPRGMMVKPQKGAFKPIIKVMKFVLKDYKFAFLVVLACIAFAALATLSVTLFIRSLIDVYILPLIGQINPDFSPLAKRLLTLAGVLFAGLCSLLSVTFLSWISQTFILTLGTSFHSPQYKNKRQKCRLIFIYVCNLKSVYLSSYTM